MQNDNNREPVYITRARVRFSGAMLAYRDKFDEIPFDAISIPDDRLNAVAEEMERAVAGDRQPINENEFGYVAPEGAYS